MSALVIYIFSGCSILAILDLSEEQSSLAANALVRNLVEAGKVGLGEEISLDPSTS
jgi:hypothetical protein